MTDFIRIFHALRGWLANIGPGIQVKVIIEFERHGDMHNAGDQLKADLIHEYRGYFNDITMVRPNTCYGIPFEFRAVERVRVPRYDHDDAMELARANIRPNVGLP